MINAIVLISQISPLVASVICLVLGIGIFLTNSKNIRNTLFLVFSLILSVWAYSCFIQSSFHEYRISALYDLILYSAGVFAPTVFLHLADKFTKISRKPLIVSSYIFSCILFVINLTPLFRYGVIYLRGNRYVTDPNIGWYIYCVFFIAIVGIALYDLYDLIKKSTGRIRLQSYYLLLSFLFLIIGGGSYFVLILTKISYPFDAILNLMSSIALSVYEITIAYAIARYRFMDIRVVIKKGLVYAIVTGIISALYIAIISGAETAFRNMSYYNVLWLTIPSIILLAFIFAPLIDLVQNAVDKTVFKKQYLANQVAMKFSEGIKELMDIDELSKYITRSAIKVFKLKGAACFILNEKTRNYECRDARGDLARFKASFFVSDDPRVGYIKDTKMTLIADELPEGEILNSMKEDGISIYVPSISVKNENALLGFLLASERGEDHIFSEEDIYLLDSFGSQSSLSIENSLMYRAQIDEIEKTMGGSRMSDLGEAAAGVAHEAKNALVSIYAVSQLLAEKMDDAAFLEKTKNMISSEVERMRILMEGVINYSDPIPLNIRSEKLKELLDETAILVRDIARGKGIALEINVDESAAVKADKNTMKQIFLNLFLNAIEAIVKDGKIMVSCHGGSDGRLSIIFKDTGPGIPAGKLKKILEPFYTTKQQGTGLGLAIVKKSIESNGGTLEVESKAGDGASFVITLNAG